jgi:WD40 repeat protein
MRPMLYMLVCMICVNSYIHADDKLLTYRELLRLERGNVSIIGNLSEYFAFSPDNSQIAAAAEMGVYVWNIHSGEVIHRLDHDSQSVSWSPDGAMIATGSQFSGIYVWYAESGNLMHALGENTGRHSSWSPDGRYLVTDAMKIFDANTGEVFTELGSNWNATYEAHWSLDGEMIATPGGWTGEYLNLWSTEGDRIDTYWAGTSAAWSPDSTQLASAGQIREVETGLPLVIIPQLDGNIAWHPMQDWVAGNGENGITLWHTTTGEMVTTWRFTDCYQRGFTWSPDGNYFAVDCIGLEPEYHNDLIIGEIEW